MASHGRRDQLSHTGDRTATEVVVALIKKPAVATGLSLWLLGLYFCLFAAAPVTITPEMERNFFNELDAAQRIPGLAKAEADLSAIEAEMDAYKVWFWRFRPEYRARVEALQPEYDQIYATYSELDTQRRQQIADAQGKLGVWSEFAVMDVRQRFWDLMGMSKDSAKRSTFYGALFSIGRRDEDLVSFLLRMFIDFIISWIMALVMATIFFVGVVIDVIIAYQASFLSAIAFFAVAMLGAAAMVATFIFLLASPVIVPLTIATVWPERLRGFTRTAPSYLHEPRRPHQD
ncbi:uncharacterized protein MONBRDRAFT_22587 [Monosiga brevicollis MX1]|uniref:Uncharacterized protein n=1 Tax=Monosiga brevicollis TaxID=81824 RepID=A9UR13_MONBE|nr:uncharacterized protein MONBRDRAFT_22587 [Monosiga brevicollis MX1]EDQ92696.1 predicted protein [Monosiga brevicollis MX1]|eukprot:XP_001742458.1 hypothetical protein [Monosiga brevicollis MX1]